MTEHNQESVEMIVLYRALQLKDLQTIGADFQKQMDETRAELLAILEMNVEELRDMLEDLMIRLPEKDEGLYKIINQLLDG